MIRQDAAMDVAAVTMDHDRLIITIRTSRTGIDTGIPRPPR